MDAKRRVLDEEKGGIDHNQFAALDKGASKHDESTASVTTCASPKSADGKTQATSSLDASSTRPTRGFAFFRALTPRWLDRGCYKGDEKATERRISVQQVHHTPMGYPRLAAFLDSDDNFMLYRRFGYLQSRVLLEKQDDLRQLEEALKRLDEEDVESGEDMLRTRDPIDINVTQDDDKSSDSCSTGNLGEDSSRKRKKLLLLIANNIKEYGQLLTTAQAFAAMNKPTSGEQCSVRNWMENVDPVCEADASFVEHKEDLITLRPGREHAWLDAGIEKVLQGCKIAWIQVSYSF
jgi:hypothetical protein